VTFVTESSPGRRNAPEARGDASADLTWPIGQSDMARRMRRKDWAATGLGPPDGWPASLRMMIDLILSAPTPLALLWGLDGVVFHNDAFIPIAGSRHPATLGTGMRALWRDGDILDEDMLRAALAGRTVSQQDRKVDVGGDGDDRAAWFDIACCPVFDERGAPAGALVQATETTLRVPAISVVAPGSLYRISPDWSEIRRFDGKGFVREAANSADAWFDRRIHPDDRATAAQAVEAALAERRPVTLEHRIRRADGSDGWALCRVAPSLDDAGDVREWFCVTRDITVRRAREAALRESEARCEALFDAIDEGVCLFERLPLRPDGLSDYRFVAMNPAMQAMFGVPDLIGQSLRDAFADEAEAWCDDCERVLETGAPLRVERECPFRGMVLETFIARINDGPRPCLITVMKDVTARRQAEDERRETARRQAFLLSFSDALRAETGADAVTARAVALMVKAVEADVCYAVVLRPENDRADVAHQARRDGEASTPESFPLSSFPETWRRTLDRTVIVDDIAAAAGMGGDENQAFAARKFGALLAAPVRRGPGAPIWALVAASKQPRRWTPGDIALLEEAAERCWTAIERAQTEAHLARYQRMEALGRLTGGIAHDFNNLLTVILGNLELAETQMPEGKPRDRIHEAIEAVEISEALTSQLLRFARRRPLEPEPIRLDDQVASIASLLSHTLGERIEIALALAAPDTTVRMDAGAFESALINIAVNAKDAMPQGGRLTIGTMIIAVRPEQAAAESVRPGAYARVTLSDTGVGMSPETLHRAFEPFFTTKPESHGTGLGLSNVYSFARQSGGFAAIESRQGRGTTVSLCIPTAAKAPAPPPDQSASQAAPAAAPQDRAMILVVDDNAPVRAVTVKRLEALGYGAVEAASGREALAILKSGSDVCLVLTDIVMPGGVSGHDLAAWVADHRPEVKVLKVSGHDDAPVPEPDRRRVRILNKPYAQAALAAALRDELST
jgi:PAS domain S-box-containing protein